MGHSEWKAIIKIQTLKHFVADITTLKWIDYNPSMDKKYAHYKLWNEITHPFPNFSGATVEV